MTGNNLGTSTIPIRIRFKVEHVICVEEVLSSSVDFRQQIIASAHFEGSPFVSFQVQQTVVHLNSCDNKQQPLWPPLASIVTLLSHNPYLRYPKKKLPSQQTHWRNKPWIRSSLPVSSRICCTSWLQEPTGTELSINPLISISYTNLDYLQRSRILYLLPPCRRVPLLSPRVRITHHNIHNSKRAQSPRHKPQTRSTPPINRPLRIRRRARPLHLRERRPRRSPLSARTLPQTSPHTPPTRLNCPQCWSRRLVRHQLAQGHLGRMHRSPARSDLALLQARTNGCINRKANKDRRRARTRSSILRKCFRTLHAGAQRGSAAEAGAHERARSCGLGFQSRGDLELFQG